MPPDRAERPRPPAPDRAARPPALDRGARDRTRALYDAAADDYAAAFADDLARLPLDRAVLDAAPFRGTVLDVGCGPGQVGGYLAERGIRVVGCDLSTGMLRVARRRAPARGFVACDVRQLAVGTGRVGGAVAFYCLHHLSRAELPVALGELRRVIVRGGALVTCTHLGEGDVHIAEFFDRPADADAALYDASTFVRSIEDAGFRVDDVRQRGPAPGEADTQRIYVTATSAT